MKKRVLRFVSVMAAVVLFTTGMFLSGCGERENPVSTEFAGFNMPSTQSLGFTNSLEGYPLDPGGEEVPRTVNVYLPPGYAMRGEDRPYPVLYLLHDFGFDNWQFEIYNLSTLVNDLLAKGEIKPMLIVTIDASNLFGLGMYANSSVCGNYEDLIFLELVGRVDDLARGWNVHWKAGLNGREARAIGGLGFGGQAAIKLAIKHPDWFSSVSALNAPLAFAGDGETTDGFLGMFKYFFIENGVAPGDYDAYAAVRPNKAIVAPITDMLFAMSAAFSPTQDLAYLRPWTVRFKVPGYTDTVYFDLPFDHHLYVEGPVWDRWLEHDPWTLLANNPDSLNNVAVYIDAAQEDQYGFHLQTAIFVQEMRDLGLVDTLKYQYHTYSGTMGLTADHQRMIGTRLADLLKFHSAHLAQPAGYGD